jgi:RNA polymerase sigma-70 factor (ECF subfamily)
VGDPHTAEDLTSEVFLRMIRSINGYQVQNVAFEAWLFQIARNLAIDHYRKSSSRTHLSLEEDMIAEKEDSAINLDHNLTSDMLVQALEKLTDVQRDVIVMRFITGLPIAKVAQALHKSENAIKALQRRALGALRETLTEWEITYV